MAVTSVKHAGTFKEAAICYQEQQAEDLNYPFAMEYLINDRARSQGNKMADLLLIVFDFFLLPGSKLCENNGYVDFTFSIIIIPSFIFI